MANLQVEPFLLNVLGKKTLLSPYLFFFFVSDVLSRMVLAEVQVHNLRGMVINKHCLMLSHLFFVDDSLFFMETSKQYCQKILEIIEAYGATSG